MRDFIFADLMKICTGITLEANEVEELLESAHLIEAAAVIARKEGLLAVDAISGAYDTYGKDEWAQKVVDKWGTRKLNRNTFEKYLAELFFLMTDGTEPEYLQEIGYATYCSSDFGKVEKIKYLLYLEGTLHIQAGTNPKILKQVLAAFMPPSARQEYFRRSGL